MSEKVDRAGVHVTHCCPKCGCKYYDPNCPVKSGMLEAEYPCEDCERDSESLREQFSRMSLSELTEAIKHLHNLIQEKL